MTRPLYSVRTKGYTFYSSGSLVAESFAQVSPRPRANKRKNATNSGAKIADFRPGNLLALASDRQGLKIRVIHSILYQVRSKEPYRARGVSDYS